MNNKIGGPLRVSIVISTLGKSDALHLVFEGLATQSLPPQEIIIVDQSSSGKVKSLVAQWSDTLPLRRITSPRGVSIGRNFGWKSLADCDVVAFPDDDCTYTPDVLSKVAEAFVDPTIAAVAGRLQGSGSRLAFDGGNADIDRRTAWTRAIEATTFYAYQPLIASGGFAHDLGIGGTTPWQSGEGTDLLLRVMRTGMRAVYKPSIVVTEHQSETSPTEYLQKIRNYGRGTGRVYRLHYSLVECGLVVLKPFLSSLFLLAKGDTYGARRKRQASLGRLEGLLTPKAEAWNKSKNF